MVFGVEIGLGLADHSFGWGLAAGFSVSVLTLCAGPVATESVAIWGATERISGSEELGYLTNNDRKCLRRTLTRMGGLSVIDDIQGERERPTDSGFARQNTLRGKPHTSRQGTRDQEPFVGPTASGGGKSHPVSHPQRTGRER